LSFTYQYKIGDTEWSEERYTDLKSFKKLYYDFEWPLDNSLKNKDWEIYKSAILLRKAGTREELEFAAIDTEGIVIFYTADGEIGFQRIINSSAPSINLHVTDHAELFFEGGLYDAVVQYDYEQVKYPQKTKHTKDIIIPSNTNFKDLNLDSFLLHLLLPLIFFLPFDKVNLPVNYKIIIGLIASIIFLPKIILLVLHSIHSKKYHYIYAISNNKLYKFKNNNLMVKPTYKQISNKRVYSENGIR
jgi:hypothetical protein